MQAERCTLRAKAEEICSLPQLSFVQLYLLLIQVLFCNNHWFQHAEAYLEPFGTSTMKFFYINS